MKKLLTLLTIIPCLVFGQADTITIQPGDLEQIAAKDYKFNFVNESELQITMQVVNAVDAKANQAVAGVNTANALLTQQGAAIKQLQTDLAGISVVNKPLPKLISGNYTLTEADRNGTLYANGTATINCPTLSAGFECAIIRIGTGAVSFTGVQSRLSYRRISSQFGKATINYITNSLPVLSGDLTK